MSNYIEDRRIIRQAIADNKLVIFVGAGASINSGIPLWKDAVSKIYDRIGPTTLDKSDTLKIPQMYYNARGEKEYNELVKDIFKYDNKSFNKIHEYIVKLSPCHVITTNYDDFLEKAFVANGEFLDIVQKDTEIPYCKNSRMILKMHGGFIYNNFVFKEDDYLNYSYNFALMEIFIKSLVAKNVILFIGYSYNDPDTKQIFNWVKHILGGNLQRAYFIDARNTYDFNIVEYYKNLGINIMYSSEYLKEHFVNNKIYENTIDFLEYIALDEQEMDAVDIAYNSSKQIQCLNYIMSQYIPTVFNKLDVTLDNDRLHLLSNKAQALFTTMNNDLIVDKSIKYSAINSIFNKTMLRDVYIYDHISHKEVIVYTVKNKILDDIYNDINEQNLVAIKKYADSVNMLKDVDNQEQLFFAYCQYELHEYQKCYTILKKVSLSYKQQQNYVWYFISEFNRHYVGKVLLRHSPSYPDIELRNEIEKIDLSEILYNNALKGKNENLFLKDLENLTLMHQALSKVLKTSEKVEKDTKTNFVFSTGIANIDLLDITVSDFYYYLQQNHLMIDIYTEVKEVYKQYINAVFYSHSKKEKEYDDGFIGPGKNKVLKEMNPFTIIIICKYMDKKTFDDILIKSELTTITLSSDAEAILMKIINNYFSAIDNKLLIREQKDKILVVLKILALSTTSQENICIVVNKLTDLMSQRIFSNIEYDEISSLIVKLANKNIEIFSSVILVNIIHSIGSIIKTNRENRGDYPYLLILFRNTTNILHEQNPNIIIEDEYASIFLENRLFDFLPELFTIASQGIKEKISQIIVQELERDDFNHSLYYNAIMFRIISESKDMEDRLYAKAIQTAKMKSPNLRSYPDPLETILFSCVNLDLNAKIIDRSRFAQYTKDFPEISFLYDMNNFDYSKFDIAWFTHYSNQLKTEIIKNQTAYKEIKPIIKQALLDNDYDKKILSDYLQYFDRE